MPIWRATRASRCWSRSRGAEALALAREFTPTAISLDMFLPDMLGWTVLSQLKQDPRTRHIPVQIITLDEDRQHGLARGAFSFITKPTTTEGVEEVARAPDRNTPGRAASACWSSRTIAAEQLGITRAARATTTSRSSPPTPAPRRWTLLREQPADCVVLDLRLPDMTGFEVLEQIRADDDLVATCRSSCSPAANCRPRRTRSFTPWRAASWSKGVESPERLLDETALFLHRVITDLPPEKQRMLERLHNSDEDLVGRTVLLVDDDARNIFALSSVLERRGMKVLTATTGREAIALLQSQARHFASC